VLHTLAGKTLLAHVLDVARALKPAALYTVCGYGSTQVREAFADAEDIVWIEQTRRLGTGHAVQQAVPFIPDVHRVLVLYGDVPLLRSDTLQALLAVSADGVGLITAELHNPYGYGRIVRGAAHQVRAITEEKDADDAIRAIREINTGIMLVPAIHLRGWLENLRTDNEQGEYYLTDIVAMAVNDGMTVHTRQPADTQEILGVNDRVQLAALERYYQQQQAEALMRAGVTLRDPARLDIRGTVTAAADTEIDVNVVLEGEVSLGRGVFVGPYTFIRNSRIGEGVHILSHSVIENADIGAHSRIGPFARIRPDTVLAEEVHIGNFVEIKKSSVGQGSKINHLTYVGDSEVGREVNIGAGTITCNYDGINKHKTVIGDRAFIGSDSQLVAPISVGAGATVGAGTTLTRDAPADKLTVSRSPQTTIEGWQRPVKKKTT
jgi:bifunctional UDP-N-acetylglucosamine pyrophosphorylase/glucosamine-1-phosphate N-acetyltransferase